MAFNAGDLVATIRLEGTDKFQRDARSAGNALQQTGQVGQRIGGMIRSGMSTAAGGTVAAGAAATAYVSTLFRTGAAYNTLQQTSRSALKTLLGSTEAVNAQMAQLDDFARNSPFSKATFIQAQQQLLGFGVEAKKVIPILGAVQDATAAVGGSNQQISEIVSILAKISSSGKITAEDLNQLGERGLDAASLLGQGFGKSAAEIRKDISAGAIDAGKAIDVLTEQMTARFGGAAANVKQTWSGAVDRIKAAQREIGATLAEPFISQQGGGMAVIWGNQVADVLRAVLAQTQPVVTIFSDRLAPAFAGFTRGLDEARVVIKSWDSSRLESFLVRADQYGPAIAVLGGAIAGWTGAMARGIPVLGSFVGGLNPLTGALTGAALASPEVRAALADLLGVMRPLVPVAADLGEVVAEGLNEGLPVAAALIEGVTAVAGPMVRILGEVPTPVLASVAAFIALRGVLRGLDLQRTIDFFKRIGEQMAVQRALAAMEGTTARLGGAFAVASAQATGFGNSMKAAFMSNPIGLVLTGVATAAALVVAAMSSQAEQAAKTKEAIAAYRDTLTETGDQTAATADKIRTSLEEAFDASSLVLQGGDPLGQFGMNIAAVTDAIREGGPAYDGLIARLKAAGEETTEVSDAMGGTVTVSSDAANAAKTLAGEIENQREKLLAAQEAQRAQADATREALAAMTEFERSNGRINEALAILRDTASDGTEKLSALKQVLDELAGNTLSVEDAQQQLNDQVRSVADALAQTDENGNRLAATLVDSAGKIDTTTAAGSRLRDEVMGMRDAMLDAVVAADAQAKANGDAGVSVDETRRIVEEYSRRLREQAEAAGLSEDQIAGLISTMDETPEVLAYAVTDEGTVDAEQLRLIQLAAQIRDTPNGHFEVRENDIPGLRDALRRLGIDITSLPTGTVRVRRDDGSYWNVENTLNALARDRWSTVYVQTLRQAQSSGTGRNAFVDANGGLHEGLSGARAFADGGMPIHDNLPTGIYAGRPRAVYKFAEAETRWEAFISGKAGQEERNRKIAAEAVRRLGGVAKFGPAAGVGAFEFANGGIAEAQAEVNRHAARVRSWTATLRKQRAKRDRYKKGTDAWEREQKVAARYRDGLDGAKSDLERAREDLKRAKEAVKSTAWDWTVGLRRGDQKEQGETARGGLSLVDEGRDVARSIGGRTGRSLDKVAYSVEKNLVSLEKRAEKAAAKVESAENAKEKAVDAAEERKQRAVEAAEERKTKLVEQAEAKRESLLAQAEKKAEAFRATTVAALQSAVEKASDKLSSLREASAQLASTVESTIRSKLDLGTLATATTTTKTVTDRTSQTVAGITLSTVSQREVETTTPVSRSSVLSGLRSQASAAKKLADKVKRLGQMGFNASFIQEVLSLGLEQAEPMIDALLSMSRSDIGDVNKLYGAINSAAAATGQAVADRNYGSSIAAAERSLAAVEQKLEAANLKADAIVENAKLQGDRLVESATAQGDRLIESARVQGDKAIEAARVNGDRQIAAAEKSAAAIQSAIASQSNRIVSAISSALTRTTGTSVKRAAGGPIVGPGTGTSDSVLARLSNGEHVWTAEEVKAVGGHDAMRRLRAAVLSRSVQAFAHGGPVIRVPVANYSRSAADAAATAQVVNYNNTVQVLPERGESVTVQARRGMREVEARMRRWRP